MTFDSNKHSRQSIRLKNYDYSQAGAYFITICTSRRQCLFGEIIDGKMELNEYGKICGDVWAELPNHYSHVNLNVFIVMPNHLHGIIALTGNRAGLKPAPTTAKRHSLSEIVRGFKPAHERPRNIRGRV